MDAQVYVDRSRCNGCGSCHEISPRAFSLDEASEKADFIGHDEQIDYEELEKAATICPNNCIEIEQEVTGV